MTSEKSALDKLLMPPSMGYYLSEDVRAASRSELSALRASNAALERRVGELEAALRGMMQEAVVLSKDTLAIYEREKDDAMAYGWDLGRWRKALAAKDAARAALQGGSQDGREVDPSTWTQEQLKSFLEHALLHGMKQHKPGSYERAAYEASIGMIVADNGPWWRRMLGRIVKWRGERRLRRMRVATPLSLPAKEEAGRVEGEVSS